jgi:IS30 family transposase
MPYQHFTSDERDMLQVMTDRGAGIPEITRVFGKHISSIYRELSRNTSSGFYISHRADNAASKRRRDTRPRPKRGNAALMKEVESRIRQDHSPEQIAGRLKLENPGKPEMHVAYETIYQHVYARILDGEDLGQHLRQGHKKRRRRLCSKDRRGIISNRRFIDKRPAVVEKKARIGDWEGDTIEGGGKKGYVGTFVERKTKFLVAYPLKHKSTSKLVLGAFHAFAKIPKSHKKTLTVDNGKEFAAHADLGAVMGVKVFFAHPYHSWERGLNEHTNGLLRQYLPKKQPLDDLNHNRLASIINMINNRPRKVLGYRTPREVFFKLPFALRT